MPLDTDTLLQQLRSLLAYHEVSGIDVYPYNQGIAEFLKLEGLRQSSRLPPGDRPSPEGIPQQVSRLVPALSTIDEIADEVRTCSSCGLHRLRLAPVPGAGGGQPRLLIVGGWMTAHSSSDIFKTNVLGLEEDKMLAKMLAAIHLSPSAAFVTNVVKCGITEAVQPTKDHISACLSYLYRQIAALAPDVICTMGIIATRTLLQTSLPLSQLRGRFHEYKGAGKGTGGRVIALMPTYHPSFLLKNPEMKVATWNDLQLIEKRLKV